MMEYFAKVVYGFQPLNIFDKNSIIDVWLGPKYASESFWFFLELLILET